MTPLDSNLTDWFGRHLWAIWLGLGLLLAAAEMLTLDLTLLMLAAGALAGAGTAAIFPGAVLVQIIVAVVVSISMLGFLRPTMLKKIRNAPGYRSSIDSLVGNSGLATAEITSDGGEVKVEGQLWNARSYDPSVRILQGHHIEVMEVDGTTLVVYPADRGLPPAQRNY